MTGGMQEHIHNSNLIESIDDPLLDANSLKAWEYISSKKRLTFKNVCELQKIITLCQPDLEPIHQGYTRSTAKLNVYIGGITAPAWWLVDGLLHNWLLDLRDHWGTLTPKEMHVRYEHIHPFVDGNGRSGRMLMWWHEKKLGREPTLVKFEERRAYYDWF